MLAFECFEERWEFPKAYHLFYYLFYKAAVGDKRWKASLEENKPFGNSNTEAFALMLLKNNYHAWMARASTEFNFENQYEIEREERKHRADDDDYESSVESTKKSILDVFLPNFEYYLITNEDEHGSESDDNGGKKPPNMEDLRVDDSSWAIVMKDENEGSM